MRALGIVWLVSSGCTYNVIAQQPELPDFGGAHPLPSSCPGFALETCNGIDDDCNGLVDDNAICPNGGTCINTMCQCLTPTGSFHAKFVANSVTLPQARSQYAVDLNGDGKLDNQYGNIVAALMAQNVDLQGSVEMQVGNGQTLILVDEQSSDAQLSSDGCAGAEVTSAEPTVGPDFSGNGSFSIDPSVMAGHFAGAITGSRFLSTAPATATSPIALQVYLPLFSLSADAPAMLIPLTGAQLSFSAATRQGQINGAIKKTDIQAVEVSLAAVLTQQLEANPTGSSEQQIAAIFDSGGTADPTGKCGQTCQNPDGSCAVENDGHVSTCEVSTNTIVQNVLAPDVDLFDAAGNWAPNPANTDKDSLSVGFAFTAVPAKF